MTSSSNLLVLFVTVLCSCIPHASWGELSAFQQLDALKIQTSRATLENAYYSLEGQRYGACTGFMPDAHCPGVCTENREITGVEDCSKKTIYRFMPPTECLACSPASPCDDCAEFSFMPFNECTVPTEYYPTPAPSYVPTAAPTHAPTHAPAPHHPQPTAAPTQAPAPIPHETYVPKPHEEEHVPSEDSYVEPEPTEKYTHPEPAHDEPSYTEPEEEEARPTGAYPGSENNTANGGGVSPNTSSATSATLSANAIVGIVLGCLALVGLVALVAVKKFKKKKATEEDLFTDPNDLETAPDADSASYAAM